MSLRIPVVEDIMHANHVLAADIRARLDEAHVYAVNFMASPGAGKTTFIDRLVTYLAPRLRIAYVDGDIATSLDAERIARLGVPSVQINTGGNCHLDANMIGPALDQLSLDEIDFLFVENVGNLVCPANFELGTHLNVLIASVPEGDDKPFKYPSMYRGVDVVVLNKLDLLPYIPFDIDRFFHGVTVLNPGLASFQVSALHGNGVEAFADWLFAQASRTHG